MSYSIIFIFSFIFLIASCVKGADSFSTGDIVADTGGGTTGSTEVPAVADPLATQAWHLKNTGQKTYSTGSGVSGEDISVAEAIAEGYTGVGVRVAVSDSGTDIDHEDLTGTQLAGEHRNYANSNPTYWRDVYPGYFGDDAHGTAVAGLIAAEGWNGIGSRGVAPGAKYAAFRFLGDYNATEASYIARTIDQSDGDFDIFNYSYGYDQCQYTEVDETVIEAIQEGTVSLRDGLGAIYVQSAGNSFVDYLDGVPVCAGNTNVSNNLATPEIIVVGAINASGTKSSYSTPGSSIWVSAPGGENGETEPAMLTTDISGCGHGYSLLTYALNAFNGGRSALNLRCSYTSMMSGTSSAAPVLSGVIALMLQANPALSWRDVKHILAITADEVDYSPWTPIDHPLGALYEAPPLVYDYKWVQNSAFIDFSNWYGFGRVNALSAVILANTYTFPLGTYEKTSDPRTDEWYHDSGTILVPIPELDLVGATSTLTVDHNFFIESVQVEVTIDHLEPSNIAVTLISPNGTESRLLNFNSLITSAVIPTDKILLSNAFYGEESAGAWTIRVDDGDTFSGVTGNLTNWKIRINGHRITGDGSFPSAVTNVGNPALGSYPSVSVTPPVPFTFSISGDVVRYEMSVGTAPGLTDMGEWTSVALNNTSAQLTGLQLTNFESYYINVRAIDNLENASPVSSAVWTVNL
jgi:subtilisin family serine protease